MEIEFTIDWLSVTLPSENSATLPDKLALGSYLEELKPRARWGYTQALQYESGALVMYNEERPEMGTHIVLSGSCLRWMQEQNCSPFQALAACRLAGARVSRIDLAVDMRHETLMTTTLGFPSRRSYKGRGRTPKLTTVSGDDGGWTVYVGSRSSDKFLRIYDKAVESKLEGEKWVRIELECKGMIAHFLGHELPTANPTQAYAMACELIRGVADFESKIWDDALSQRRVEISLPKRTGSDTLKWLVNVCAPTLARTMAEKPSEDVLGLFYDALRDAMKRYNIDVS